MKKHLLFILALASFFSCTGVPEPDPIIPGGGGNGGGNSQPTVVVPTPNFTIETQQPLTVVLKNTSSNATSYTWDFGDGSTSNEKSPTHRYAVKGVYKITLTAKSSTGHTDTKSQNVTLEEPTKIYTSGVTYKKIPYNNEYYRIKLIDDDFFTTTWVTTKWTMLSSANLPFYYEFNSPILLDGLYEDDYYVLNVYYNSKTTGDGTKCAAMRINTSQIYMYPLSIPVSVDNCAAELHFIYK